MQTIEVNYKNIYLKVLIKDDSVYTSPEESAFTGKHISEIASLILSDDAVVEVYIEFYEEKSRIRLDRSYSKL